MKKKEGIEFMKDNIEYGDFVGDLSGCYWQEDVVYTGSKNSDDGFVPIPAEDEE